MVTYLAIKTERWEVKLPSSVLIRQKTLTCNIDQERAPKHCKCVGQNSRLLQSHMALGYSTSHSEDKRELQI